VAKIRIAAGQGIFLFFFSFFDTIKFKNKEGGY
jgi:hypothetical protein